MENLKSAETEEVTETEETASATNGDEQTVEVKENGSEDSSNPAQEETDWKAQSRKHEQRAKELRRELSALKGEASPLSEDLQTAKEQAEQAKQEADELKAELEELQARHARHELVKLSAKANKVDAELLDLMRGESQDEIDANAKLLHEKLAGMQIYPSITDSGSTSKPAITKENIMSIKDTEKRLKAIAENKHLF